jgi:hypothetical protein
VKDPTFTNILDVGGGGHAICLARLKPNLSYHPHRKGFSGGRRNELAGASIGNAKWRARRYGNPTVDFDSQGDVLDLSLDPSFVQSSLIWQHRGFIHDQNRIGLGQGAEQR